MTRTSKIILFRLTLLSIILFIVGSFFYHLGQKQSNTSTAYLVQQLQHNSQNELAAENAKVQQCSQKILQLEQQINLHEQTLQTMRHYVQTLQLENANLLENTDIYKSLVDKQDVQGDLVIKKFKLYNTANSNRVRYSLILSKIGQDAGLSQGEIDMAVHGTLMGKTISLPVQHHNLPKEQPLQYKFKVFQELAGELMIPEDFTPMHVSVRIHPNGADSEQEKWFDWEIQSLSSFG